MYRKYFSKSNSVNLQTFFASLIRMTMGLKRFFLRGLFLVTFAFISVNSETAHHVHANFNEWPAGHSTAYKQENTSEKIPSNFHIEDDDFPPSEHLHICYFSLPLIFNQVLSYVSVPKVVNLDWPTSIYKYQGIASMFRPPRA